ncbi:type VI secretion system membrane subunit TssM [Serratia sp. L9]|uniref:type VI secretion system membrane subunit TssM n=1 Tax=Serratia sp. L9 TaxID=3423946 RepID=UPI003D66BC23
MSLFYQLFSGRGLKRLLLIVTLGLLAVAIWFLGPWLGFGDARPLEPAEGRIIALLVLFLLLLAYWFYLPLFLSLALIAIATVWIIGPYLLIGKQHPLESAGHRGILMLAILIITLLYGLWRFMRALALDPALLDNFIKKKPAKQEERIEHAAINAVIEGGERYMRRIHRTVPIWRRFFSTDHRRSWLPWFLVMGTPAAGKTAMLFSSGQEFPLPEQLNRKDKENPPTAHCECLFTNEALFLDTAGKYAGEDRLAQEEWTSLVKALKKHRPVRGINGVILTLSTVDILNKSKAELLTIAATLRSRLDELRQQLGVRFPVYVTITKLDLLAGFEEYFRNLTAMEREQVWGVTLPWDNEQPMTAGALKEQLEQELSLLENRLSRVMYLRQQEEYDVGDRKRMYALPQDFRLLSQNVTEVVQNIFFASRYDETQFHATLRGVYFLSNCHPCTVGLLNNNTLLQKWSNLIRQVWPQTPASLASKGDEEGLITEAAWGKHYFLTRLFSDVITPDRNLVSYNLQLQSKHRLQTVAGHMATWGVGLWLFCALLTSYQLNQGYLQALAGKLGVLSGQVTQYVKKPSAPLLPGVLLGAQNLARYDNLDLERPEMDWRYGLYTGGTVAKGADALYHFFLQRYLLPQLEKQAVEDLQNALRSADDDAVWQALKLYLMLNGTGKQDQTWLVAQLTENFERSGAIRPYEERSLFVGHLNALFSHPGWHQYGQAQDPALVKEARARLAEKPQSARVWQRLKTELMAEAPANLTLRTLAGGNHRWCLPLPTLNCCNRGSRGFIPGKVGNKKLKKLLTSLLPLQNEDGWVMGAGATSPNPLAFREEVLTRYLQEYTGYWQRMLSSVRLIPVGGEEQANSRGTSLNIALLRALVSDNSPLRALLNRSVDETTLVSNDKTIAEGLNSHLNQGRVLQQAVKLQQTLHFREQRLIGQHLDDRFSALRHFVRGEQQGGPADFAQVQGTALNHVMRLLSDQYTRFVVYNSAFEYGDIPPLTEESARIAAESGTWPEPVKNIVSPLLTRSYEKIKQRLLKLDVESIDKGPGEICRTSLQGRYPFADSEQNVALVDFERFFAAGGWQTAGLNRTWRQK